MAIDTILEKPSLDYDDRRIKRRLYLETNEPVAYLNQEALADLKWSLWWLATEAPEGEDISIWSSSFWWGKWPNLGTKIGYCEIALAVSSRTHVGSKLRLEHDRLDIFVTRQIAYDAFAAVQSLGFTKSCKQQAKIFAVLRIELLDDALWSKV